MNIFPAIDLYEGQAVRLFKGDYAQMTVYSDDPPALARKFHDSGARFLHVVDLEGARGGGTPNLGMVRSIVEAGGLQTQVGGGIRSEDTVKKYLDIGVMRVILGTAALENPDFLAEMLEKYGERIAVGVDVRDGLVAVRGWLQTSGTECFDFIGQLSGMGVKTVICTDISRDGAMRGANLDLYRRLSESFGLDIVASGGVSSLDDLHAMNSMGLYGAILGKALYTGSIDLAEALEAAK